jgi:hypothetical protein
VDRFGDGKPRSEGLTDAEADTETDSDGPEGTSPRAKPDVQGGDAITARTR